MIFLRDHLPPRLVRSPSPAPRTGVVYGDCVYKGPTTLAWNLPRADWSIKALSTLTVKLSHTLTQCFRFFAGQWVKNDGKITIKSSKMIGFSKFLFWTLATSEGYHLMQKTLLVVHLRRLFSVRCIIFGLFFMYFF